MKFETLIRGEEELVQLKANPFEPSKDAEKGPQKSVWYICLERDPNISFRVFKRVNPAKNLTTAKIIWPKELVNAVFLQF